MKKKHIPVTVKIEGEELRLGVAIDKYPAIMLQALCSAKFNTGTLEAILSEFARRGLRMPELMAFANEHPEWGVDPNVLGQV